MHCTRILEHAHECRIACRAVKRMLALSPSEAINRVSIDEFGNQRQHLRNCLLMPYTKSVASSVLAALELVLERAPLTDDSEKEEPELRILCVGFGGGSVPAFFTEMLPDCRVDVVELEPAVLDAAESMGFVPHPRINVYLDDGAKFVHQAVHSTDGPLAGIRITRIDRTAIVGFLSN